jgi:hypothetical protein
VAYVVEVAITIQGKGRYVEWQMTSAAVGERHIGCNKAAHQYPDGMYRYQADHDR